MSAVASICRKYGVVLSNPARAPTGLTILLPGTLLKIESYNSTQEVLLSKDQLVIGFKTLNPFPIVGKNHSKMADDVVNVVKDVCALDDYAGLRGKKYNIVGHSLGGKVALMVAAKYDKDNVNIIVALDPVDDKPQELTFPKAPKDPITNLNNTKASQIHLLQSELGGTGWPPQAPSDKNATVIKDRYPDVFVPGSPNYTFFLNLGAEHMSYLDDNTDQASKDAREYAHTMIRDHIGV